MKEEIEKIFQAKLTDFIYSQSTKNNDIPELLYKYKDEINKLRKKLKNFSKFYIFGILLVCTVCYNTYINKKGSH